MAGAKKSLFNDAIERKRKRNELDLNLSKKPAIDESRLPPSKEKYTSSRPSNLSRSSGSRSTSLEMVSTEIRSKTNQD